MLFFPPNQSHWAKNKLGVAFAPVPSQRMRTFHFQSLMPLVGSYHQQADVDLHLAQLPSTLPGLSSISSMPSHEGQGSPAL